MTPDMSCTNIIYERIISLRASYHIIRNQLAQCTLQYPSLVVVVDSQIISPTKKSLDHVVVIVVVVDYHISSPPKVYPVITRPSTLVYRACYIWSTHTGGKKKYTQTAKAAQHVLYGYDTVQQQQLQDDIISYWWTNWFARGVRVRGSLRGWGPASEAGSFPQFAAWAPPVAPPSRWTSSAAEEPPSSPLSSRGCGTIASLAPPWKKQSKTKII